MPLLQLFELRGKEEKNQQKLCFYLSKDLDGMTVFLNTLSQFSVFAADALRTQKVLLSRVERIDGEGMKIIDVYLDQRNESKERREEAGPR